MNRTLSLHRAAMLAAITLVAQSAPTVLLAYPGAGGTSAGSWPWNKAPGDRAMVAGGENNSANAVYSFIGGGSGNTNGGPGAVIGGGYWNTVSATLATIGGGNKNTASGPWAGIGSGFGNTASGQYATIGGGSNNTASGQYATIGGGAENATGTNEWATIGGGRNNTADGAGATVGGGVKNAAFTLYTTVAGGAINVASNFYATVGGGVKNAASARYATVGGGESNTASGQYATIGGGFKNTAIGLYGFIGGGWKNAADAKFATVPGGARGKAMHAGSFVWSGMTNVDTVSTNANSFTVRAPGGVRFITSATATDFTSARPPYFGVVLLPGNTQWTALSDRESKTDFQPIKPREVLSKLAAMPVTSWKYKHDPSRRYIGPTSQDFMEAFHLGDYDKGINALDADGVTFAAIKGLVEELKERDSRIEKLETELRSIREQLSIFPPVP